MKIFPSPQICPNHCSLQDILPCQPTVQGEEGQLHTSRLWGLHVYLRWRVGGHDWHIWGEGKIFIPISMMLVQGHLVVHALFDYIIHHMVSICGQKAATQTHTSPLQLSNGSNYVSIPHGTASFKKKSPWEQALISLSLICDMEATHSKHNRIRASSHHHPGKLPTYTCRSLTATAGYPYTACQPDAYRERRGSCTHHGCGGFAG